MTQQNQCHRSGPLLRDRGVGLNVGVLEEALIEAVLQDRMMPERHGSAACLRIRLQAVNESLDPPPQFREFVIGHVDTSSRLAPIKFSRTQSRLPTAPSQATGPCDPYLSETTSFQQTALPLATLVLRFVRMRSLRSREVVVQRQQPTQEIKRAGENNHLSLLHSYAKIIPGGSAP